MSRIDLGLAANAAVVLAVGHALLYALGLARLRASDLRLVGLSYLAGWALLGSALSLALVVGIGPNLRAVGIVAATLVGACAAVGRRTTALPPGTRASSRHPLALASAAVGALIVAVASVTALAMSFRGDYTGYWDSVQFWIPKAETIYYDGGLDAGVWGSILHPEYPPLIPTANAATFHFAGGFHPSVLPFQSALLGVAFLLAALALLDRFAPRWFSLPTLALLATTPWFWWRIDSPFADPALSYLIATAALALVMWLHDRRGAWIGLAGTLLVATTLTKLEGGFLAGLLILVGVSAGLALHGRGARLGLALLVAPAAIVPWRLWLAGHDLPTSATDYHPSDLLDPGFLADRTGRLTEALEYLLRSPFGQLETAAMVCIAATVLAAAASRIPVISAAVGAWVVLSLLGLATIYWIGRLEIGWYLDTSASRVGTTVIVAAATVTPLLLGLALERAGSDEPGRGEL